MRYWLNTSGRWFCLAAFFYAGPLDGDERDCPADNQPSSQSLDRGTGPLPGGPSVPILPTSFEKDPTVDAGSPQKQRDFVSFVPNVWFVSELPLLPQVLRKVLDLNMGSSHHGPEILQGVILLI